MGEAGVGGGGGGGGGGVIHKREWATSLFHLAARYVTACMLDAINLITTKYKDPRRPEEVQNCRFR